VASKLGMSHEMLKTAIKASYGEVDDSDFPFLNTEQKNKTPETRHIPKIQKTKVVQENKLCDKFQIGDSVMIYPDKKIGIVCEPINEKGTLRVQLPNKKIWINHKRVKLHVAASQLYPEDYDFAILFETVEERKTRHEMSRMYTTKELVCEE
jgi:hypothetical protein